MGQGFVFVNKNKMEYIDSTINSSARFKSMINDDLISKLITRLVCVSNNDDYKKYKKEILMLNGIWGPAAEMLLK